MRTPARPVAALLTALTLAMSPIQAEMERLASVGERQMNLHWWPKVIPPPGWFRDYDLSMSQGVNMHLLEGETFDGSPAVMYTRAFYHDKGTSAAVLEETLRDDRAAFQKRDPGMKIDEIDATATGDGKKLRTFAFTPGGKGDHELVAYGLEPKYMIMFCLSARSAKILDQHRAAFRALVKSYTSKDDDG